MSGGLCLIVGLLVAPLGDAVMLRWTHSIQKVAWEEDYRRAGNTLQLVSARVRGTGAGMEPPPDAVFRDGAWHYTPSVQSLPGVILSHTPYAPPYIVCNDTLCQPVTAWLPGLSETATIELAPCRSSLSAP